MIDIYQWFIYLIYCQKSKLVLSWCYGNAVFQAKQATPDQAVMIWLLLIGLLYGQDVGLLVGN